VLYPALEATATMSRDHVEVSQLANELLALRSQLSGRALDARLTPEEAAPMFEAMAAAAKQAKSGH